MECIIDKSTDTETLYHAMVSTKEFLVSIGPKFVDKDAVDILIDNLDGLWYIRSMKVRVSMVQDALNDLGILL